MLMYVDISLFDSPAQTLVNTVNTVGVMGKGIAAIFKQLYPEMYQRYRRLCQEGKLDVGMLYIYRTPNKIIVNLPTKKHWRQRSRVEYIKTGLEKFVTRYEDYGISSVSFPQLGCGHGELDWETQVQPVMERYLRDLPIPVYIHLYPKSPDFIPERLDIDYARQVRLERQRISAARLWQDLQGLVSEQSEQAYYLTLFGPTASGPSTPTCERSQRPNSHLRIWGCSSPHPGMLRSSHLSSQARTHNHSRSISINQFSSNT